MKIIHLSDALIPEHWSVPQGTAFPCPKHSLHVYCSTWSHVSVTLFVCTGFLMHRIRLGAMFLVSCWLYI